MTISIITPSFRSSQWLRLCVASVADQAGVSVEHIVQDSCSDDDTPNWLPTDPRVKAFIEKDKGMYDAVNRGFRRASGDILAYLNCDEQFLPGALQQVEQFFAAHPSVDVVLADTIITDSKGDYICHRPSLVPGKHQIWIRFPVLSSSLFLRRRVVHELGIYVDTKWRDLGDCFWVMEMVNRGVRMAVLPELTSVFTDTGENMNLRPNAIKERQMKWEMTPGWVKRMKVPIVFYNRLRLALRRVPVRGPFDYALYTLRSPHQRELRHVARPTTFWKGRVNQWADSAATQTQPSRSGVS